MGKSGSLSVLKNLHQKLAAVLNCSFVGALIADLAAQLTRFGEGERSRSTIVRIG